MTIETENENANPEGAENTETPEQHAGDQAPAQGDAPAANPPEDPPKKKHGGFQKRISKLVAQKHELKEKLDKANTELEAMKEAPREEDFDSEAEFVSARVDHLTDKKILEREAKDVEGKVENLSAEEQQAKVTAINDVMRAGVEAHPDYLQKVTTCPLPDHVADAALNTDDAVEVLYHIGTNPLVAMDLAGMEPDAAAAKVNEIAASLQNAGDGGNENKEPAAPGPMDEPAASSGGGAGGGVSLRDDISMDEWAKRRNAQAEQ